MAINVIRHQTDRGPRWAVLKDAFAFPLDESYPTTGAFFEMGGPTAAHNVRHDRGAPLSALDLLSPVTSDGDYICQGLNYAGHLREIGRDPADAVHNIIFQKAASCISGPYADIVRPPHVKCLDYEIELGLVMGRAINRPEPISDENFHLWIGGFVITNDVSARDVQVSHEQFHKAKSYRTFGPTGPYLSLLTPSEAQRWSEFYLELRVNGEVRQAAFAGEMVHGPGDTLRELSEIRNLKPGDMIATGTPAGVALKAPNALVQKIAATMTPEKRAQLLVKSASNNPNYLAAGDVIECTISTSDGAIDLGRQRTKVVDG